MTPSYINNRHGRCGEASSTRGHRGDQHRRVAIWGGLARRGSLGLQHPVRHIIHWLLLRLLMNGAFVLQTPDRVNWHIYITSTDGNTALLFAPFRILGLYQSVIDGERRGACMNSSCRWRTCKGASSFAALLHALNTRKPTNECASQTTKVSFCGTQGLRVSGALKRVTTPHAHRTARPNDVLQNVPR